MKLERYFSSTGARDEQSQLDIISNNMANANTPGYKKDVLSFSTVLGEVAHIDMSQGPTRQTGNNLDVALSGAGFLSVQTPNGTLYTRAGDLAVDSSSQLVTQDGYPVLGQNGSPIKVTDVGSLRITEDGQVFDANNSVGQLNLVDFPQDSLQKVKGGYFQPVNSSVQPGQPTSCIVHQGAIEEANVNTVKEMAMLIETTRQFESDQKTFKDSSNLDSELINKTSG